MIKKIVVIGVLFSFLTQQPLCIWAQSQDAGGVFENMELKAKPVSAQGAYRKFTCPSCSKEFEFQVDPNDTEMRQGTRKVVCPYDGQAFYPGAGTTRQEDLRYEEVRCPDCGKEFRAYIDVKALLAGRSQTLTCPYDSRKFYFKAEGYHPEAFQRADLVTVTCPTDKRTFKAYVDPANARELTCPYDGTRFFPAPEMIVTEIAGVRETSSPNGYGERASPSSMILGQPQQVQATQGVLGTMAPKMQHEEEKPSRVEETFSEHIPLNVSTALKQFGYNIFKPVEKVGRNPEKSNQSADGALKNEGGLLKTLLGGNQQSGFNTGTADTDGDFSPFNSPTEIPMISDYVLGPGDKLRISVWGQLQESFPVTVDAEGKIMLPKIGPLYLWGVKFSDAEQQIKDALGKNYTNIQITVSLAQLRTIKVFVLGEAVRPGAYTISALSNAFNALYAAGGPTKTGSLRKIKLVRKGAADRIIDLYDVLLKGENSQDYKLEGSETIFVSPIGDVIGVAGNVKRPAIYELNGKAKLADCLAMAGGLSSVAYLQRIQLERVKDHDRKVVLDLEFKSLEDLTNSPNNLDIQDGDLVIVFPITSARYNFVSITGSVLRPGDYELKEGMILKDLIAKAGGVLPGTYLKRAEIARFKGDQMREIIAVDLTELASGSEEGKTLLKEWDVITLYSQRER
ncbi:MAG: SLBB domain-containing protein, partial [Candidatus Omnitrophota bacterium]